jgi:hypothetical protein
LERLRQEELRLAGTFDRKQAVWKEAGRINSGRKKSTGNKQDELRQGEADRNQADREQWT